MANYHLFHPFSETPTFSKPIREHQKNCSYASALCFAVNNLLIIEKAYILVQ